MSKLPTRLFQYRDGGIVRTEFASDADVIAAMEIRGYAYAGPTRHRGIRAELRDAPTFDGLLGPMWDGNAIRYEDRKTNDILST